MPSHNPSSRLPMAPRTRPWNGPAARSRMINSARDSDGNINVRQASRGFAFIRRDGTTVSDYRLPFADLISGTLTVVFRGVTAALGRLNQVQGMTDSQRTEVRNFLEGQRDRFGDDSEMSLPDVMVSTPVVTTFANLKVNGESYSEKGSLGLLQQVNNGTVASVEFDAITFIDGQNSNNFRFRPEDMTPFAESFVSMPFLRDHDQRRIESRDGTILDSRNQNGEFHQTIKLTTQRGIRSFAEGQIDRFSIGWDFSEMLCSLCGLTYFGSHCPHIRGQDYGDLGVAEVIFTEPEGVETSAVNVPAVKGTRILAALDRKKNHLFNKLEAISTMDDDKLDNVPVVEPVQSAPEPQEGNDEPSQQERIARLAQAIAPLILAELMGEDLQETFVNALTLPDIIERLTRVEQVVTQVEQVLAQTVAEQNVLGQAIDLINQPAGFAFQVNHDDLKIPTWNGSVSSTSVLDSMPQATQSQPKPAPVMPPKTLRPPLALQKEHSEPLALDGKNITNRQRKGAAFMNNLLGGK